MNIDITITDEQIRDALDRQVRVAIGLLFESKEIKKLVQDEVRAAIPKLLASSIEEVSPNEIKNLFIEKLKEGLDKRVQDRLKGL